MTTLQQHPMSAASLSLPVGVEIHNLNPHRDERGALTEIHRNSWPQCRDICQYSHVVSRPNALRGIHVHPKHTDYLYVSSGCMHLMLVDIRKDSETFMQSWGLQIQAEEHLAITIEPGVAHGFYFAESGSYINGVDAYWDMADELGCRWNDPLMGLIWPCTQPLLSERDQDAGTVTEMIEAFHASRGL